YQITRPGRNTGDNSGGAFAILPSANLTIENDSGGAVTINGNGIDRVFDINPNFFGPTAKPTGIPAGTKAFTVTLSGGATAAQAITITGGNAVDNSPLTNTPSLGSGGAIRDQGNASLTVNNIIVNGNTATNDGGGISMENTVST